MDLETKLIVDFYIHGSGVSEFLAPKRPYFDEEGFLWVTDRNNHRVKGVKPGEKTQIVEADKLPQFVAKEGNKVVIGYYDKGIEIRDLNGGFVERYGVGKDGDACFHNGKIYVLNSRQDNFVYQLPEVKHIVELDETPAFIASNRNRLFVATHDNRHKEFSISELFIDDSKSEKLGGICITGELEDFSFDDRLFLALPQNIITFDPQTKQKGNLYAKESYQEYRPFSGISVRTFREKTLIGITKGHHVGYYELK